jgi:hypothetical protein
MSRRPAPLLPPPRMKGLASLGQWKAELKKRPEDLSGNLIVQLGLMTEDTTDANATPSRSPTCRAGSTDLSSWPELERGSTTLTPSCALETNSSTTAVLVNKFNPSRLECLL